MHPSGDLVGTHDESGAHGSGVDPDPEIVATNDLAGPGQMGANLAVVRGDIVRQVHSGDGNQQCVDEGMPL